MFSTKIMYPWGLEKLQMNAPLEVSSFSRPQNYTVKPPLTARIRMLRPPPPPHLPTPTTTATQSSRCGKVRPHTKQTYYRYSIISSSASEVHQEKRVEISLKYHLCTMYAQLQQKLIINYFTDWLFNNSLFMDHSFPHLNRHITSFRSVLKKTSLNKNLEQTKITFICLKQYIYPLSLS